jgi:formate hydrogenlyase transcriptional activator
MRVFRKYAPHYAENDRVVAECQGGPQSARSPAAIAVTTRRPALFDEEHLKELVTDSKMVERALAEGIKTVCAVPILSRDRVLGVLMIGSTRPAAFSPDDVELLGQVAQQIAIAVDNGLAFQQIAELKKSSTESYLEDEIRTERNFEDRLPELGTGSAKQIEIVAPTDSTVPFRAKPVPEGTGRLRYSQLERPPRRTFVKLIAPPFRQAC